MSDANTITTVRQYLEQITEFLKVSIPNQRLNGYTCFEDFVLKHGMEFKKIGQLPKREKMGRAKLCYRNSTRLVLRHPNLTYVEGYACGIIPVMHAWCVTKDGTVIDPTWKDADKSQYFGVPFKHQFLIRSAIEHGVYGLIDLWKQGWPTLKAKPEEFLEKGIKP